VGDKVLPVETALSGEGRRMVHVTTCIYGVAIQQNNPTCSWHTHLGGLWPLLAATGYIPHGAVVTRDYYTGGIQTAVV
jgi:hypothetical protein